MPLIFEQQEEEGARAFEAFCIYRDAGASRSLEMVSRSLEKNPSLISRWASDYQWSVRARAYDMEQDRLRRQAFADAIKEMAERHAKIAVRFQAKLLKRLENLDPEEIQAKDMARWLETAVKIERLSRGVSTDNIHQEITGADGAPLEVQITKPLQPEEVADVISTLIEAGVIIDAESRPILTAGEMGGAGHNSVLPETNEIHSATSITETEGVSSTQ